MGVEGFGKGVEAFFGEQLRTRVVIWEHVQTLAISVREELDEWFQGFFFELSPLRASYSLTTSFGPLICSSQFVSCPSWGHFGLRGLWGRAWE